MSKWSIINKQDNNNMIWICTFPINSKMAGVFAKLMGSFIQHIAKGLFGKGNTIESGDILTGIGDNKPSGILSVSDDSNKCPQCNGMLLSTSITEYDNRIECSQCDYFIVRDAC